MGTVFSRLGERTMFVLPNDSLLTYFSMKQQDGARILISSTMKKDYINLYNAIKAVVTLLLVYIS